MCILHHHPIRDAETTRKLLRGEDTIRQWARGRKAKNTDQWIEKRTEEIRRLAAPKAHKQVLSVRGRLRQYGKEEWVRSSAIENLIRRHGKNKQGLIKLLARLEVKKVWPAQARDLLADMMTRGDVFDG